MAAGAPAGINHLLTPGRLNLTIRYECAWSDPKGAEGCSRAAVGSGELMAHILEFRSSVAKPELEAVRTGGAEIIIFPGVRREHHDEAPAKRRRERGRTKRDRLELPD